MFNLMNDRDYELITAYIDGALTEAERKMFESRLSDEPELQRELNSLRQTVILLRQMPELKAPRNFTLIPAQVEAQPVVRTALPFPLTATFSALSAAAAVILLVFGGYFLLQTGPLLVSSPNAFTTMQQEPQQAAPTGVALALTATPAPTSSPMPTPLADLAQVESESAPAAALAPPGEAPEEDPAEIIMMFEADDGALTPAQDEETAAFRMAATEIPVQAATLTLDSAADTAAGSTGAVMMATRAVQMPNPLLTDAPFLATLSANLAQYSETQLPATQAAATEPPALQAGADENDLFAEPTVEPTEGIARDSVPRVSMVDVTGLLLLAVGGLLLVIAIGTTLIRRRRGL